mmetsp:Transcript_83970/g.166715  ORF Transcript_83970/g.166715 Transcript_83970/m.166715 type:complete len:187 (-) Transcript_83970:2417-2977(-)
MCCWLCWTADALACRNGAGAVVAKTNKNSPRPTAQPSPPAVVSDAMNTLPPAQAHTVLGGFMAAPFQFLCKQFDWIVATSKNTSILEYVPCCFVQYIHFVGKHAVLMNGYNYEDSFFLEKSFLAVLSTTFNVSLCEKRCSLDVLMYCCNYEDTSIMEKLFLVVLCSTFNFCWKGCSLDANHAILPA